MTLFKSELKMSFKTWLIWTLCVGGLSFACIFMYSSLEDTLADMSDVYSNMGSFSAAFGMDKMNISTLTGFYATEIAIIFSLGGAMFAALAGSSVLSKEEALHTSEFLNTFPAGRGKILCQKFLSVLTQIVAFNIACIALFFLGFFIMGESVPTKEFVLYHSSQIIMQIEIATICFMISAFSRKIISGAGIGLAVILYLGDMMCRIIPAIENVKYIIPFYYSNAADIFTAGKIDSVMLSIGVMITLAAFITAYLKYTKKDLAS